MTAQPARFVINVYPSERRIDLGLGSCRYVKCKEYRVIDRDRGTSQSFYTKVEAQTFVREQSKL